MTPTDAPDAATAYDLFWATVEDPTRAAPAADPTDAYAAFDAAAES
jgi:hypothetical protein